MKLSKMSVELWLEDLAMRTAGSYRKSFKSPGIVYYEVENSKGTVSFIKDIEQEKWFYGTKEITEFQQFYEAMQSIERTIKEFE